ncbi:MAG: type II secretion system protein GspG [Candidatus Omnitrophota bacterium]
MKTSNSKGFTLIEMVVVLAVVAILAAILTPTIAKNISDAKMARANNEIQVIAASIGSFYKDLGRWPTSNGADLTDTLYLLYGPGNAPTVAVGAVNAQYWLSDGTGWGVAVCDTLENQLISNSPKGVADYYPTTGTELYWRGPYIAELKADPWGDQYAVNIRYAYNTTTNFVGVFSAGPDRQASTRTDQALTGVTISGDDLIYRLQ